MTTTRTAWNKGKKEPIKHWYYTNGEINIRIPYNQEPPQGFYRGRLVKWSDQSKESAKVKREQTCLSRYGDCHYNNIKKCKETKLNNFGDENYNNRAKSEQTCLERYGVLNPSQNAQVISKIQDKLVGHDVSQETRDKISNARSGQRLTPDELAQRIYRTNKTFHERGLYKHHKTRPELFIQNILETSFGQDNVLYSYVDKERYPFKCDFYIKSCDLFIEVHAGWRHGSKPFNEQSEDCVAQLNLWREKSVHSASYRNAIYQWTDLDVRKLRVARENNLNYACLYSDNIYFSNEKPRELLETLVDLYRQQDNQQPRRPIWS